MEKYFLLHNFIYGWDVSHFTENNKGTHVVLMDTIQEAQAELEEDDLQESDLWRIEKGILDLKTNKILTKDSEYDYYQD